MSAEDELNHIASVYLARLAKEQEVKCTAKFETFAELIISDLAETDSPTNLFANSLAAREVLSPAPIFYWPRFGGIFIE